MKVNTITFYKGCVCVCVCVGGGGGGVRANLPEAKEILKKKKKKKNGGFFL